MSQIKQCQSARRTLEQAISALLYQARNFDGVSNISDLLAKAREYGRAMNRLERVRR